MRLIFILLICIIPSCLQAQTKYEKDFLEFWTDMNQNYAYFKQQGIQWNKVKEIYSPLVKEVKTETEFIVFLETVLQECFNGHVSLNTNLSSSNKLIPSGQDLVVEKTGNRFYIKDLRIGFGAERCGLNIGDEVVQLNGKAVEEQLLKFLPKAATVQTPDMMQYALDMLFAGTHDTKRIITISKNGQLLSFYPDSISVPNPHQLLTKKVMSPKTAYIKINNSLGNNQLIQEFDAAIDEYLHYDQLILDLTETPGGGNTTVARSIMGRFIQKPMPYQQHELDESAFDTQRMWVEYATPRKTIFKGKLYVLVSRWTGSMGEGLAIGFDGMKRAQIIGTKMAGLLGAIYGFRLTETGIGFQVPAERLYHINGTPREKFVPSVLMKNLYETLKYMERIQ